MRYETHWKTLHTSQAIAGEKQQQPPPPVVAAAAKQSNDRSKPLKAQHMSVVRLRRT